MPNKDDPFADVDLGSDDFSPHDAEDHIDHGDEPPAPPRRRTTVSSAPAKGGLFASPLMRIMAATTALAVVGVAGYAGYNYVSVNYLSSPPQPRRTVVHREALPAPPQPQPGFPEAQAPGLPQSPQTVQPPFPGAQAGFPQAGFPQAGVQGRPQGPQVGAAGVPFGQQSVPVPGSAAGFPVNGAQMAGVPAAAGLPGVPNQSGDAQNGLRPPLPMAAPVPMPAPIVASKPTDTLDRDSLIDVLNSKVVDVFTDHLNDGVKQVKTAIQDSTTDVKADVDAQARTILSRLDAIMARTDQTAAKVYALATPPAPVKGAGAGALHHPAHRLHPHRVALHIDPAASSSGAAQTAVAGDGWHLRGVGDGFVVLQHGAKYTPVWVGKPLPDNSAVVEGITKRGDKFVVRTSAGLIQE